jgi:hypothetical protein
VLSVVGKNLLHIRAFNEIMESDFAGQTKYFAKRLVFHGQSAPNLFREISRKQEREEGCLFSVFKLKTRVMNCKSNFFSDESLEKVAQSSYRSLNHLVVRNAFKLTEPRLTRSLSILQNLKTLDLSFCR